MGTGIAAAIPILIKPRMDYGGNYFSTTFFSHYSELDAGGVFIINENFFLENYTTFLDEFYDLIGKEDEFVKNKLPKVCTFEEFTEVFDRRARNGRSPFVCDELGLFSFSGGVSSLFWHFYSGSYKALLEEYSSLLHFEKILQKSMKNPLANVVKYGLFG